MAKFDIYEAVTERIIQQLQQGVIPWQKPWTGTQHGAISGTTGKQCFKMAKLSLMPFGASVI